MQRVESAKIWYRTEAGTAQEHTRHGCRTARSKTEIDGENDALLWRTKNAAKSAKKQEDTLKKTLTVLARDRRC